MLDLPLLRFKAFRSDPAPKCLFRNTELLGDLLAGKVFAFPQSAKLLVLLRSSLHLASPETPTRACRGKAGVGALTD